MIDDIAWTAPTWSAGDRAWMFALEAIFGSGAALMPAMLTSSAPMEAVR